MTASPATTLAKHELTETERNVVHDIFVLARERSLKVQAARQALRAVTFELITDHEGDAVVNSDEFGDYLWALTDVLSAITPAALALVPILAPLDRSDGARIELLDRDKERELERFLRPIFEQAGIGDDFTAHRDPPWPERDEESSTG